MNIFEKSLYVKPGKVLGYALRPFSAFHASTLLTLGSPFLLQGSLAWGDLVTAILVCTSKREDGLSKVLKFQNNPFYRLVWRCGLAFVNVDKHMERINNHISIYFDYPDVWSTSGSGKKSGAPWAYFMVSLLWQETQSRVEEIWDMSLIELSCHKAIRDELQGGQEIATGLVEERERNRSKDGS